MFSVLQAGYRSRHREPLRIDRSGLPFYVFVYFRGRAEAEIDSRSVPVQGRWILFPPGAAQHYRSTSLPYEDDWVHFTAGEEGAQLLRELHFPLGEPVLPSNSDFIENAIWRIQDLQMRQNSCGAALAQAHLMCLFDELSRTPSLDPPGLSGRRYTAELTQLRTSLFSNPSAGTTVESLAARIGLSGSYLQALYKAEFGTAIGEDMIRGRIDRAKYLLANSETPISSVAEASGYRCEAHFMRQFKRVTGMTPGEFRRSTQQGSLS